MAGEKLAGDTLPEPHRTALRLAVSSYPENVEAFFVGFLMAVDKYAPHVLEAGSTTLEAVHDE